jgi:hypothetical protein
VDGKYANQTTNYLKLDLEARSPSAGLIRDFIPTILP